MFRKIIDTILTINLIFIVGYIAYLWHAEVLIINFDQGPDVVGVEQTVYDIFASTLQQEVDRQIGVPIEGYEPQMFMELFPGLVATDFDGVEASIGLYEIQGGQLVHKISEGELVHSAATAINRRGMNTLLDNVATRLGVNFTNQGTITEIMDAISAYQ